MQEITEVDPDELLSGPEVARLLEISSNTWRGYVMRGLAPAPDVVGSGPAHGRRPKWRLETVREFMLSRKGQGFRSDREGAA